MNAARRRLREMRAGRCGSGTGFPACEFLVFQITCLRWKHTGQRPVPLRNARWTPAVGGNRVLPLAATNGSPWPEMILQDFLWKFTQNKKLKEKFSQTIQKGQAAKCSSSKC